MELRALYPRPQRYPEDQGQGEATDPREVVQYVFGSDLRHLRHLTYFAEQVELRNEIAEVKSRLVEESHSLRRSFSPEREQSKKLQSLGLSEREAVEYTLMLSRDEEIQRAQRPTEHVDEQDVIEADESSGRQSGSDPSFPLTSVSLERYPPPPLSRHSTSGTGSGLLVPPPTSNVKVQVSPRFHPEPTRAGGLLGSPSDSQSPGSVSFSRSKPGPTSSRATSSKQASTRVRTTPAKQNAWRNPLPGTGSSASPGLATPSTRGTNWEAEAERIGSVEDVELRFALELSLAEAQSRECNDGK
jgi:hypothetical protein